MRSRPLLLFLVFALQPLLAALASPVELSATAGRVRIRAEKVRPKRLGGSGGPVQLRVAVSGARPMGVRAQALVSGSGGGNVIPLSRRGGGWTGLVSVPANYQPYGVQATLMVYVDLAGGQVVEKPVSRIEMLPSGGGGPPPPPR